MYPSVNLMACLSLQSLLDKEFESDFEPGYLSILLILFKLFSSKYTAGLSSSQSPQVFSHAASV